MAEKKKVGLVLSGGGVKCLAHIAFIELLTQHGIYPDMISGTSGGALVGALYASGYDTEGMLRFFEEIPMFGSDVFTFGKIGVVDSDKYVDKFRRFFPEDFSGLKQGISLSVTATNLMTGMSEFFHKGDLIRSIIASSAFPLYFSPIKIGEFLYNDGGLLNNFPTEPLQYNCDVIFGSFVNPVLDCDKKHLSSYVGVISRVYEIVMDSSNYHKFDSCDYVFIPQDINSINLLNKKQIYKAYEIGERQVREKEREILSVIEKTLK